MKELGAGPLLFSRGDEGAGLVAEELGACALLETQEKLEPMIRAGLSLSQGMVTNFGTATSKSMDLMVGAEAQ